MTGVGLLQAGTWCLYNVALTSLHGHYIYTLTSILISCFIVMFHWWGRMPYEYTTPPPPPPPPPHTHTYPLPPPYSCFCWPFQGGFSVAVFLCMLVVITVPFCRHFLSLISSLAQEMTVLRDCGLSWVTLCLSQDISLPTNIVCAPSEHSDQPVHPSSLIILHRHSVGNWGSKASLGRYWWLLSLRGIMKNILRILHQKFKIFRNLKFWYSSYFCSKHRLWVLVRTALARRF